MIYAFIGYALVSLAIIALLVRSALSSKDARMAALDLYRGEQGVSAELTSQRDAFKRELDVSQQQAAVYRTRLAIAEKQRNDAQADAQRAVVEKIKSGTAKEAADTVNEILAKPLGSMMTELK